MSGTQYSVGFLSSSRQNFRNAEITELYKSLLCQEHIRSLQVPKKYINYNNTNIYISIPDLELSVPQAITGNVQLYIAKLFYLNATSLQASEAILANCDILRIVSLQFLT